MGLGTGGGGGSPGMVEPPPQPAARIVAASNAITEKRMQSRFATMANSPPPARWVVFAQNFHIQGVVTMFGYMQT